MKITINFLVWSNSLSTSYEDGIAFDNSEMSLPHPKIESSVVILHSPWQAAKPTSLQNDANSRYCYCQAKAQKWNPHKDYTAIASFLIKEKDGIWYLISEV
jgi:hypothetical protein